jgi:transcriptional regulator with XRE-family HTH domain
MQTGQGKSPSSVSLGRRLKTLRLAAGVSYEKADIKGFGSPRTVKRREAGIGPFNPNIVRGMCEAYGASAEETQELVAIVEGMKDERIFEDRSDLMPPEFGVYVDFESRAAEIYMYHPELLPGLLQTAQYARTLYEAVIPALSPDEVERFVSVRLARQRVIFDPNNTVRIEVVLGEGALARQVGGETIAAAQLKHVQGLIADGKLAVWVLPFSTGAHAAVSGPFTLLRGQPDVVYIESSAASQVLYKAQQLRERAEIFAAIRAQSIPIGEYAG